MSDSAAQSVELPTLSKQPLAPDDPRHGTQNGYGNLGCRCARCRRAQADYVNEYRWRTGRRTPFAIYKARKRAAAEAKDNHGTVTRYGLGCRCDECKAASAAARREHRHANIEATRAYDRERKRRKRG